LHIQDGIEMAELKTVGVIGAGQMGNGIAHVAALAGYDVIMTDISDEALAKGVTTIEGNMRRQVMRHMITDDAMMSGLKRIRTSSSIKAHEDADIVIEAATEKREIKEQIFRSICEIVPAHTYLATNTSSISVTRLASVTDRPDKFIGMHFMNPVPLMKLMEVIRGLATSQDTYETAITFAQRLEKTTTNAEDYPAFIVNRILVPMINEAVYTLYEGVGTVESIDTAMRLGANHPMGPLTLADFIGLDTCLSIMQVLHDGLADTKYRPCPLLVKYVEAGWVGKKVGKGFYDYTGEHPVPTR
jgi:3-hydroxybutyryl-CoA dehydrogenase